MNPWWRSRKVLVFLMMLGTFAGSVAAMAPETVLTILAGGVVSVGTAAVSFQGLEDRERAKRGER